MNISFGTKAETLDNLLDKLSNAKILPQLRFTAGEWAEFGSTLLIDCYVPWLHKMVIVRSSSVTEDDVNQSLAGHFKSVADVAGIDAIVDAINSVIDSFTDNNDHNQVFIQPMLKNVVSSGVVFTKDVNTGAPYYVINYDDNSGYTDTVTSGNGRNLKTFYHAKCMTYTHDDWKSLLIAVAAELEKLFDSNSLDIEFAFDKENTLFILQVRALVDNSDLIVHADEHKELLSRITSKVKSLSKPHPYLHGERSVFGIMPDWNPAEIIGVRPRPLALSLYKELITDNIWAYQRSNYGYRDLRSFPLMINFCGLPYIDVRVSFNSFIPAEISDELANKLVNYYITQLSDAPNHHDKVEFEIIYSCYTLDLVERLKSLETAGFSKEECKELQEGLRELTNNIISNDGLWKQDIKKIDTLELRREEIICSELNDIEKIYWLLEDCKRYGTLPFAGLARAGFIAVQLLNSLATVGILTKAEIDEFMNTLNTVSSSLANDLTTYRKEGFLVKYGHLRPGTYELLSPRYDENPEIYFDWFDIDSKGQNNKSAKDFKPSIKALGKIADLLNFHQLDHDILSFFDFIKDAIEGREYAKFIFTKSLSEVLRLMTLQGQRLGFTKEEVAFVDINIISELYSSSRSATDVFSKAIERGKRNTQYMNSICLPPLILNENSIYSFELPIDEPNFITLKTVTSAVINISNNHKKFEGKILMIPSADPGYDWIFAQNIAGFITMFGGANSHMAIRAAELGIPAVIGAGDVLYSKWAKASKITLDCASKIVTINS